MRNDELFGEEFYKEYAANMRKEMEENMTKKEMIDYFINHIDLLTNDNRK